MSGDQFVALLDDLTATPGIAGHEDAIARSMARQLRPWADQVEIDRLGNVIARFGTLAAAPRIAVLAHLDTVGFLVKRISPDGMLGVVGVGGVNLLSLPGAAVRVGTHPGVIGVRSQHLASPGDSLPDVDDLTIQVDPEIVPDIEITMPITFAPGAVRLGGGLFCAPYLDNRAGCAVLVELARQLASSRPSLSVVLVATVQEETTCAGAIQALQAIAPDVAFFVDGTLSYDTPDTRHLGMVRLGSGPVLTSYLYVSGYNGWHAHPALRDHLKTAARESNIPFQQDAIRGLISDARVATWLGIPSAIVGLPMRGKHSPLEIAHLDDLSHAVRLLIAALHRPLPDLSRG